VSDAPLELLARWIQDNPIEGVLRVADLRAQRAYRALARRSVPWRDNGYDAVLNSSGGFYVARTSVRPVAEFIAAEDPQVALAEVDVWRQVAAWWADTESPEPNERDLAVFNAVLRACLIYIGDHDGARLVRRPAREVGEPDNAVR
jgi:hypothetical protein